MKEFIEKLIGRLEEKKSECLHDAKVMKTLGKDKLSCFCHAKEEGICDAISIVNQFADEYEREHIVDLCNQFCDKADEILQKKNNGWIPCSEKLPPHSDDLLLIQCSGKPKNNIIFDNAFCLASYTEDGWILEMYPEWKDAEVVAWKNLGEPYQPKGEQHD